jgi:hypothetical protein
MNRLKNVLYIYNGVLFSHKKNEIILSAGKWMELENIILNDVNQAQKIKVTFSWNMEHGS